MANLKRGLGKSFNVLFGEGKEVRAEEIIQSNFYSYKIEPNSNMVEIEVCQRSGLKEKWYITAQEILVIANAILKKDGFKELDFECLKR